MNCYFFVQKSYKLLLLQTEKVTNLYFFDQKSNKLLLLHTIKLQIFTFLYKKVTNCYFYIQKSYKSLLFHTKKLLIVKLMSAEIFICICIAIGLASGHVQVSSWQKAVQSADRYRAVRMFDWWKLLVRWTLSPQKVAVSRQVCTVPLDCCSTNIMVRWTLSPAKSCSIYGPVLCR